MVTATVVEEGVAVADLLVRKLDPELITRLKQQAASNGRSMESEARTILENGVSALSMAEWVAEMDRLRAGFSLSPDEDDTPTATLDEHDQRDRAIAEALGWELDETDD